MSEPARQGLDAQVLVVRRALPVAATLAVPPGRVLGILGPSGAGKSSVLAALAGLAPLAEGHVRLDGRLLAEARPGRRPQGLPLRERGIGMVTQRLGLFPHLTVAQNLGYGAPGGARDPEVARLGAALGLDELLGARPPRLSGGQRQRVALGRALAGRPRLLLLDEPFGALDAAWRERVRALVASEVARRALPTVLVSHDLADLSSLADTVLVMDQGQVLQAGPLAGVLGAPASQRVAELVGYRWFLPPGALRPHPGETASGGPGLPEGTSLIGLHPALLAGPGGPPSEVRSAGSEAVDADWWLVGQVEGASDQGFWVELRLGVASPLGAPGVTLGVPLPPGAGVPPAGSSWAVPLRPAPCFDAAGALVGRLGARSVAGARG